MHLNILNTTSILSALLYVASGSSSSTPPVCPGLSESLEAVKLAFHDARIPEDVQTVFEPRALLNIVWPPPDNTDLGEVFTYPGRHLRDNVTFPLPTFKAIGLPDDQKGPFVIIMFDPDVPATEKPSIRDFVGGDFYVTHGSVLKNQTAALATWRRPLPPRTSQEHRYVFLMYNQPSSFSTSMDLGNTTFRKFDVVDYALKNGLDNPVSGTFVYIESNASCWREGCI